MAAPHVTGAVALARQMFPDASGAALVSLVLRTATDIGDPGVDDIFGWGFLNVGNLVSATDSANDPEFRRHRLRVHQRGFRPLRRR